MSRHLLDVNVLLALLWRRHEGHAAAMAWFAKTGHKAWASSPLTQLGVIRLLTNPAVTQGVVSPATALETVHELTQHEGHEFWPLDHQMETGLKPLAGRVQSHRQWTDAVLLWQAVEHEGLLVSFDAGVKGLASREYGRHVLLLSLG